MDISCGDPAVARLLPPSSLSPSEQRDLSAPPEAYDWFNDDGTTVQQPTTELHRGVATVLEESKRGEASGASANSHTPAAARVGRTSGQAPTSAQHLYAQHRAASGARSKRAGASLAKVDDSIMASTCDPGAALAVTRGAGDAGGQTQAEAASGSGMQVVSQYQEIAALLDSLRMGGWKPARKDQQSDYASKERDETEDCRDGVGRLGFEGVLEMVAYGRLHTLRSVKRVLARVPRLCWSTIAATHHWLAPLTQVV